MNKAVNNLLNKGFEVTKNTGKELALKKTDGSVVLFKSNGKVEGLLKGKVTSDFPIEEGRVSTAISMLALMGTTTTYFTTDFTISNGHSMSPTFTNMQVIINSKYDPTAHVITKNCIVKFLDPTGDRCLKRVVGLPGDHVKVTNNGLEINGKVVDKDSMWIQDRGTEINNDRVSSGISKSDYVLQENEYFVLGDNLGHSTDSRHFGPISKTNIIRVVVR
jgi:signal peptidase I